MAKDCLEILNNGWVKDGIYTIYPNSIDGIEVYCQLELGGWTRIMNRIDNSPAFYRNWNDYKLGFGDISGNHWLGFNSINKILSNGDFMVRFEFEDSKVYFFELDLIRIASEDQNYRLTLGKLMNYTIKTAFEVHNAKNFGT